MEIIISDETEERNGGEIKFSRLMNMLESEDENSLLTALNKLRNLTAFKEFQVRKCYYST